jgi:uncharacterized membrane protein
MCKKTQTPCLTRIENERLKLEIEKTRKINIKALSENANLYDLFISVSAILHDCQSKALEPEHAINKIINTMYLFTEKNQ